MSFFGGFARPGEPDPFKPYGPQREFMEYMSGHSKENPARAMCVWPRRHGKDLTALFQLAEKAHDRQGVYWHGLPTYEQARKSCWTAFRNDTGKRLMDNVFPREIVKRPREFAPASEMLVELHNGSIIQFVGSDTMDSLVGAGPVGVNASEFALWKPSAYDFIRPMLRENGGWMTFLMTPRGRNHAFKLYELLKKLPGAFVSHKNIFTFGKYTDEEARKLLSQELAEGMLEELLRQEYLCDFAASNVGSYWGDLMTEVERRGDLSTLFEYDGTPVFVNWDLGINDMTAMWAWTVVDNQYVILAHYESHNKPISDYFLKLEEWTRQYGFQYEAMYLPHDAKQRTLQTGVSMVDQFISRFRGTPTQIRMVPNIDLIDGIQAVRWLLQHPIKFHPRCAQHDGIEALRQYHREYDEDKRVFSNRPEHDWCSHSADGFRYVAVVAKLTMEEVDARRPPKPPPPLPFGRGAADLPSLDQLFKDHESELPERRRA